MIDLDLSDVLMGIGAHHGRSAGGVAIAWTLRHPAVTDAIVVGRHGRQVERIIGAGAFRLSEREIREIEACAGEPGGVSQS